MMFVFVSNNRVDNVSEEINDMMNETSSTDICHRADSPRVRRPTQTRQAPVLEGRIARLEYKMEQVLELLIQQSQKQGRLPDSL